MSKPWHERSPGRLAELRRAIVEHFPGLRVSIVDANVQLVGTYSVVDAGILLDEFRISVELGEEFPRVLPIVRELDGRIRPASRFHANADGTLCVVLPDEYWLAHREVDVIEYLAGPLRNYFLGLIHYWENRSWPFGEHEHGKDGILQFYSQLFRVADPDIVLSYLRSLSKRELKPFRKCPCGSGRRVQKCHWSVLLQLHRRVNPRVARDAAMVLEASDDE